MHFTCVFAELYEQLPRLQKYERVNLVSCFDGLSVVPMALDSSALRRR